MMAPNHRRNAERARLPPLGYVVGDASDIDQDGHLDVKSRNILDQERSHTTEDEDRLGLQPSMHANTAEDQPQQAHEPGLETSRSANASATTRHTLPRQSPWQRPSSSNTAREGSLFERSSIGSSGSSNDRQRRPGISSLLNLGRNTGINSADKNAGKRPRDDYEADDILSVNPPAKRTDRSQSSMGAILEAAEKVKLTEDVTVVEGRDGMPTGTIMQGPKPATSATLYGGGIWLDHNASKEALESVKAASELAAMASPVGRAGNYIVPIQATIPRSGRGAVFAIPTPGPTRQLFTADQLPPLNPSREKRGYDDPCSLCTSCRHKTGRCPWPRNRHGDVPTCPWHDKTASVHDPPHVLDASHEVDKFRKRLGCPSFASLDLSNLADLETLVDKLIVDRQYEAPLRVKADKHCFVRLGIYYAERFFDGDMPPKIGFVWPYLKHEACEHAAILEDLAVARRDKASMPPGILNGKSIKQIKYMVIKGEIGPQVYNHEENAVVAHRNAIAVPETFLEEHYGWLKMTSRQHSNNRQNNVVQEGGESSLKAPGNMQPGAMMLHHNEAEPTAEAPVDPWQEQVTLLNIPPRVLEVMKDARDQDLLCQSLVNFVEELEL
ncbi:hypothetical protein N0V82_010115 [Gnomoniopsis sp. IMI 355080]|nr:hypothetical protein N0V82_010115 [Gnomoniopsis sp. IMI 355080]